MCFTKPILILYCTSTLSKKTLAFCSDCERKGTNKFSLKYGKLCYAMKNTRRELTYWVHRWNVVGVDSGGWRVNPPVRPRKWLTQMAPSHIPHPTHQIQTCLQVAGLVHPQLEHIPTLVFYYHNFFWWEGLLTFKTALLRG